MAVYKRDIVDINLETGNIHRSFLKHSIGYKDQKADHFGIRTYRDGVPVDLTGVSVQGIFLPPQGDPIAITSGNIVDGNVAEVVLPQACYNYDGQFTLSIKLVDSNNSVTGTMRIVDGMVDNTHASGTVAPTAAVPTYQEILATYEAMLAATTAATTAATNVGSIVAAAYSTSATYAVGDYCTKDGNLYRCTTAITTAESWTAAHWTQTKMGPDVSDLKSAISGFESVSNLRKGYPFILNHTSQYIDMRNATTDFAYKNSANYNCGWLQCKAGDVFYINGKGGVNGRLWGFADDSGNLLSKAEQSATGEFIVTAPTGATWVGFNNDVTYTDYQISRILTDTEMSMIVNGGIGLQFEQGYIQGTNMGEGTTAATKEKRCKTRYGLPILKGYKIKAKSGYEVCIAVYTEHEAVGFHTDSGFSKTSTAYYTTVTTNDFVFPSGKTISDCVMVLIVKNSGGTSLPVSDLPNDVVTFEMDMDDYSTFVPELSVLFVGNSFSLDEASYVPALLKEAFPDLKFRIGILYKSGGSLADQYSYMVNNTSYDGYYEYNSDDSAWSNGSAVGVDSVVGTKKWDIVSFQQVSTSCNDYSSMQPYLNDLIDGYTAKNGKNVKFIFDLAHVRNQTSPATTAGFYAECVTALNSVLNETAISDFIPNATAIENARTTVLKNVGTNMTADGAHLQEGICCLVPAYSVFLTLMKYIGQEKFGVLGSQILPTAEWISAQNIPGQHGSSAGATTANRLLAAKCAIMAIKKPKEITDCSGFNPV